MQICRHMAHEFSVPSLPPTISPTPLFDLFRGNYATGLLVAAVAEFGVFSALAGDPLDFNQLKVATRLQDRPLTVLLTALRAMNTLTRELDQRYTLTPLAREHLLPGGDYFIGDYFGLARDSADIRELIIRFRTNRPKGADEAGAGTGFIFRDGLKSAMEETAAARQFTLALAGRAKNAAPVLAHELRLPTATRLVDVGGGTGLYSIALLRANPQLRAVVWDRPEVLRVAAEFAAESGVADRLELVPGDFFKDPFPTGADVVLLSNILHDWDIPEARQLVHRCGAALPVGGKLLVHDVFLDGDLGGPLPAALYSANLFAVTEGRLYSAAEVKAWAAEVAVEMTRLVPTLIQAQVYEGVK